MCVGQSVDMPMWVLVPTEATGIRCPRAGDTGGCEQPNLGAGNWTQVLSGRAVNALSCWVISPTPRDPLKKIIIHQGAILFKKFCKGITFFSNVLWASVLLHQALVLQVEFLSLCTAWKLEPICVTQSQSSFEVICLQCHLMEWNVL